MLNPFTKTKYAKKHQMESKYLLITINSGIRESRIQSYQKQYKLDRETAVRSIDMQNAIFKKTALSNFLL